MALKEQRDLNKYNYVGRRLYDNHVDRIGRRLAKIEERVAALQHAVECLQDD